VDFILGLIVGFVVLAAVAIAAYVVLRRLFERASNRVADDIGRVLAELSTRATATPSGQQAAAAARAAARLSHLGAYAAAGGMSEDAARREFAQSIERIARIMDSAVRIPIIGPVGLDAALGLFPVAGDTVSAGVSIVLIARSLKYGIPQDIIARMLANVLLDLLLGALPIAGDLADMWFRANERNVRLLRDFLRDPHSPGTTP
jgi:Domain of unknown function (DUF4112)